MNQLIVPKKEAFNEVNNELAMRRVVWKMADAKHDRFIDLRQQRKFDILKVLSKVLDVMTDQEWQHYLVRVEQQLKRAAREQEQLANQKKLFS